MKVYTQIIMKEDIQVNTSQDITLNLRILGVRSGLPKFCTEVAQLLCEKNAELDKKRLWKNSSPVILRKLRSFFITKNHATEENKIPHNSNNIQSMQL